MLLLFWDKLSWTFSSFNPFNKFCISHLMFVSIFLHCIVSFSIFISQFFFFMKNCLCCVCVCFFCFVFGFFIFFFFFLQLESCHIYSGCSMHLCQLNVPFRGTPQKKTKVKTTSKDRKIKAHYSSLKSKHFFLSFYNNKVGKFFWYINFTFLS